MHTAAISGILLRNLDGVHAEERLLWLNPPPDACWRELSDAAGDVWLFCQDHAAWQTLEDAGADPLFGDFPGAGMPPPDLCVLTLPKGKDRLGMMLDLARSVLPGHGRLWLAGANRSGIRSSEKHLRERFRNTARLDSARHCALYEASGPVSGPPFDPGAYRTEWTTGAEHGSLRIRSWPGVFAHGRLDEGTELLLAVIEDMDLGGRILDFGCGSGVISARIASLCADCRLTMLDVDALALRASRETMAANGFTADIVAGDGFRHLEGRFDAVFSNPPFHHGARTDPRMGMKLLEPLRNFLYPRGQFIMVANRHLPYREWLERLFGGSDVLASNNRFQVLRSINRD